MEHLDYVFTLTVVVHAHNLILVVYEIIFLWYSFMRGSHSPSSLKKEF